MPFNPYAAEEATIEDAVPQYSMPRGTYAAPGIDDGDAYIKEFGWSPELRTSAVQTPSAQRLGAIPRFDDYPNPDAPPGKWYEKLDADEEKREATTSGQQSLWQKLQGIGAENRWAPNPRSIPVPESRITQRLSPASYSFTRPFDQMNRTYGDVTVGSARTFNGTHFSMADNKRDYEAIGSMPVRTGRNTYRIEPTPWDINIVDMPAEQNATPVQITRDYNTVARSRSYRTGG